VAALMLRGIISALMLRCCDWDDCGFDVIAALILLLG